MNFPYRHHLGFCGPEQLVELVGRQRRVNVEQIAGTHHGARVRAQRRLQQRGSEERLGAVRAQRRSADHRAVHVIIQWSIHHSWGKGRERTAYWSVVTSVAGASLSAVQSASMRCLASSSSVAILKGLKIGHTFDWFDSLCSDWSNFNYVNFLTNQRFDSKRFCFNYVNFSTNQRFDSKRFGFLKQNLTIC
jgi:hypothetical protein